MSMPKAKTMSSMQKEDQQQAGSTKSSFSNKAHSLSNVIHKELRQTKDDENKYLKKNEKISFYRKERKQPTQTQEKLWYQVPYDHDDEQLLELSRDRSTQCGEANNSSPHSVDAEVEIPCMLCDGHCRRDAAFYCSVCQVNFCKVCLEEYHSRGPYKQHKMTAPEYAGSVEQANKTCVIHSQPLTLYCEQCAWAMCANCASDDTHSTHSVVSLQEGKHPHTQAGLRAALCELGGVVPGRDWQMVEDALTPALQELMDAIKEGSACCAGRVEEQCGLLYSELQQTQHQFTTSCSQDGEQCLRQLQQITDTACGKRGHVTQQEMKEMIEWLRELKTCIVRSGISGHLLYAPHVNISGRMKTLLDDTLQAGPIPEPQTLHDDKKEARKCLKPNHEIKSSDAAVKSAEDNSQPDKMSFQEVYYSTADISPQEDIEQGISQNQPQPAVTVGSTTVRFNPPTGQDTMIRGGAMAHIDTRHMVITSMKEYEDKSLEEVRLDDYNSPLNTASQFSNTQATNVMTRIPKQSTGFRSGFGPGFGFGHQQPTGFGHGFGHQQPTGFGSLFGHQQPTGFGSGFGFGHHQPTGFGHGFGHQQPTGFGSLFGHQQPPGFGSGFGFGHQQPTGFGFGFGHQQPTGFGSGFGHHWPPGFGSGFGFGHQQPTGFGHGFGHQQPTGFGSGFGHQQPTGFGSVFGHQQPTGFGPGFGHHQPTGFGHHQPTGFGHQQPTGFGSGFGSGQQQPTGFSSSCQQPPHVGHSKRQNTGVFSGNQQHHFGLMDNSGSNTNTTKAAYCHDIGPSGAGFDCWAQQRQQQAAEKNITSNQSDGSQLGSTSIETTATNNPSGGSLFGTTATSNPWGGSLFGTTATSNPSGGSLFGTTATSNPWGGSLFGTTATSNPPGGSLFGTTATSNPSGGSLFGTTATSNPSGGSLFGTTATSNPSGGSLFGTTATSNPSGGSLFGTTETSNPSGGSFFGTTATSNPSGGGLFGTTATSNPSGGSLFGTTATSNPSGGSLLGTTATSNPSGGSLFGTTTTSNPPGGSLIGTTATSNPPGGSLFGTTATSNPSSGSSFGSTNTRNQQSGSSFGSTNTGKQQLKSNQTNRSVFGSAAAADKKNESGFNFGTNTVQSNQAGPAPVQSSTAKGFSFGGQSGKSTSKEPDEGVVGSARTADNKNTSGFGFGTIPVQSDQVVASPVQSASGKGLSLCGTAVENTCDRSDGSVFDSAVTTDNKKGSGFSFGTSTVQSDQAATQPEPSLGDKGSRNSTSNQQAGSSFGFTNTSNQQTGSSFGSTNPSNQQSGSSFGSTNTGKEQLQSNQTNRSVFGSAAATDKTNESGFKFGTSTVQSDQAVDAPVQSSTVEGFSFGGQSGESTRKEPDEGVVGSARTADNKNTSGFGFGTIPVQSDQVVASPVQSCSDEGLSLCGTAVENTCDRSDGSVFDSAVTTDNKKGSGFSFGTSTVQSEPSSGDKGFSFGQSGKSTSNQQAGSSFGSTNTSNQQAGRLFGSTNPNNQQASSLFGSTNPNNHLPRSSFGSTNPSNQQTGSSLGSTNPSYQQAGSLFGSNNTSHQQVGSSFGSHSTSQQQLQSNQPDRTVYGSDGATEKNGSGFSLSTNTVQSDQSVDAPVQSTGGFSFGGQSGTSNQPEISVIGSAGTTNKNNGSGFSFGSSTVQSDQVVDAPVQSTGGKGFYFGGHSGASNQPERSVIGSAGTTNKNNGSGFSFVSSIVQSDQSVDAPVQSSTVEGFSFGGQSGTKNTPERSVIGSAGTTNKNNGSGFSFGSSIVQSNQSVDAPVQSSTVKGFSFGGQSGTSTNNQPDRSIIGSAGTTDKKNVSGFSFSTSTVQSDLTVDSPSQSSSIKGSLDGGKLQTISGVILNSNLECKKRVVEKPSSGSSISSLEDEEL